MSGRTLDRITIAFMIGGGVHTGSRGKRMRDWVIRMWTRHQYTHCELVFWAPDGTHMTCAVNVGYPVTFFEGKPYQDNSGWKMHDINVNREQAARIYKFCEREHGLKKPYNTRALWWNFAPVTSWIPINNGGTKWFCSEFVTAALQYGGVQQFMGHRAWRVSPDKIFRIMDSASKTAAIGGGPMRYSSGSRFKLLA